MSNITTAENPSFDRRLCIQSTLRSPQDRSMSMASWYTQRGHVRHTVEELYLPDFQVSQESRGEFSIPSVNARIQGEISEILLGDLNLERLALAFRDRENGAIDSLANRAAEIGLRKSLSSSETAALLIPEPGVEEWLENARVRMLRHTGWMVEPGASGNPLFIQNKPDQPYRFLVTNLDEFNKADPEMLQETIRRYSVANQLQDSLGYVGFNLEHHAFSPSKARAGYLNTLVDSVSIGRIIGESERAAKTFAFLRSIDWNYTHAVDGFANGHVKARTRNGYLDHMAICAANPADERQMNSALLQTYNLFAQAISIPREHALLRGSEAIPPADLKVLRNPIAHSETYTQERETRAKERLEATSGFVHLLGRVQSVGVENLDNLLESEFTQYLAVLQKFKQWFRSGDSYESFIDASTSYGKYSVKPGQDILDSLDKAISRGLEIHRPRRKTEGDFGVYSSTYSDEVYYTDPLLKDLVRLSVTSQFAKDRRNTLADSVFNALLMEHAAKEEEAKAEYETTRQEKYGARGYMFENGFGDNELSKIAELAITQNSRGEPRVDGLVYNAMFSVLYLLKGGMIQVGSSQVLRLALERAFPTENNPDAWKQFQEEIGSKYTESE